MNGSMKHFVTILVLGFFPTLAAAQPMVNVVHPLPPQRRQAMEMADHVLTRWRRAQTARSPRAGRVGRRRVPAIPPRLSVQDRMDTARPPRRRDGSGSQG